MVRDNRKVPGRRRQALILVPVALVVAVPIVDPFLPTSIHPAPLLAVAPAVAATFAGPLRTLLVGVLALIAGVIVGLEHSELALEGRTTQLVSLAALVGFLVFFSHLRVRRERELVRVRSVSEAAQRVVLRPLPDWAGPVSVASAYQTAEEDTSLGGDLFALARTPGSTRLVIGDVRGRGLASISETATMLESFRAAARRQSSLPEMVAYLEGSTQWGLAEFSGAEADVGERFVTAAVADIPDDEAVVRLVVCGHPPPLLLHKGTVSVLSVDQPAPPLGLGVLADGSYEQETFSFDRGDTLLLYTDGVTEARDKEGTFYPLAERAQAWTDCAPAELISNIQEDLRSYVPGPPTDDMAMIAVRREDPVPSG